MLRLLLAGASLLVCAFVFSGKQPHERHECDEQAIDCVPDLIRVVLADRSEPRKAGKSEPEDNGNPTGNSAQRLFHDFSQVGFDLKYLRSIARSNTTLTTTLAIPAGTPTSHNKPAFLYAHTIARAIMHQTIGTNKVHAGK